MADLPYSGASAPRPSHASTPIREDCWSDEATSTLIDAWGSRYIELNRGNLRQKDWQEVADAVNSRHGHIKKARRTDVQCKNRIDTLKKKYKVEKARVSESNGGLSVSSSWPFFSRLDALIGTTSSSKRPSSSPNPSIPPGIPLPYRKIVTPPNPPAILPQKLLPVDDSYFRRNYSAVAAAAAAESDAEEDDSEESGSSGVKSAEGDGIRRLARAISRFGEIYARVEGEKQRQMIELEKQRLQLAKDLEFQRMQMFMDTQIQIEKIKRCKKSGLNGDDMYS